MNSNRYIISCFIFVIILVCALVGYGIYINTASSAHVIKIENAQYAQVRVSKATYQEIHPTIYIPSLNLISVWVQDVYNKIDGTLSVVHVKVGDAVKKDQLLCELINDELPAQITQIESNINRARTDYLRWSNAANRYHSLIADGAISQEQLEEAVANRDAAAADISYAQAQLEQLLSRMNNQKIFAPQDSAVIKVYHPPGTYLEQGNAIVMLGNFNVLNFKLDIPDNELKKIMGLADNYKLSINSKKSNAITVPTTSFRDSITLSEADFDIAPKSIDPPLSVQAQYRAVIWQINNKSNILKIGTYYQAKIYNTQTRRVLAIPHEALLPKTESAVFIVSQNRLKQRDIRIGAQDDKYVEVVEGLDENDIVVVSGKLGLSDGLQVHAVY